MCVCVKFNLVFWLMATVGTVGLCVYGVWIPAHLFRRLKKESQDEAEQRFDPDFMESHGWLVRTLAFASVALRPLI